MSTDNLPSSTPAQLLASDRGAHFAFSTTEREAIEHEMAHYEDARAACIGALMIVQQNRGWVPDGAIAAVGDLIGIPASDVEGVATFYNLIFRQPVGRHVIKVCDSIACFLTGYDDLKAALCAELGVDLGETTPDNRFTLLPICCLGNCDKGPTLMIDNDLHGPLTPAAVRDLLDTYV